MWIKVGPLQVGYTVVPQPLRGAELSIGAVKSMLACVSLLLLLLRNVTSWDALVGMGLCVLSLLVKWVMWPGVYEDARRGG